MSVPDYLIEVANQPGGRYLKRSARVAYTDDPEEAVSLPESGCKRVAAAFGLDAYTLLPSSPILAAYRRDMQEKKAAARRVAESLAAEIRRRHAGLVVYVGGNTKREVRVWMANMEIMWFYIPLEGDIVAHHPGFFSQDKGGIENACWCLSKRIAEIRLAADVAQA